MGNGVYRPRFVDWDLTRLENITALSKQQYLDLYNEYQTNQAWGGQNMDDKLFFQKYDEMLPGEQTKEESDRAFAAFDFNKSGKLSFEEFLSVVVLLSRGSKTSDRIGYLIDQYNPTKKDNQIEEAFGKQVLDRLNQYYGISNADSSAIWSQLTAASGEKTDRVSRDQFLAFIVENPVYRTHIQ